MYKSIEFTKIKKNTKSAFAPLLNNFMGRKRFVIELIIDPSYKALDR